jgi:hypothetical protein
LRHIGAVIVPALANWLCWARLDNPDPTPGMFQSPWGTSYERMAITAAAFWAISSMFLPPIWEWTLGQAFTRLWVWGTICRALLLLVYPLVMILTTVMAIAT